MIHCRLAKSLGRIRTQRLRCFQPLSGLVVVQQNRTMAQDAVDIEDLHHQALLNNSTVYTDPSTGFTVFTELAHLKRGRCCGSQCRHCPYGWTNVKGGQRREAKVVSGEKASIQQLIHQIQDRAKQASTTKQDTPEHMEKKETKTKTKTGGHHGGHLTTKNVPYTRGGDKGSSQLLTGERRSKADHAFEAMGTVDELCAIVGVVYAHLQQEGSVTSKQTISTQDEILANATVNNKLLEEWLLDIMSRLFDVGSHLAKPPKMDGLASDSDDEERISVARPTKFVADGIGGGFDAQHVLELEEWIDLMTEDLPELRSFLLPASCSVAVAQCHVARTVGRRAERRLVPLVRDRVCDPNALAYLNRLSDFFFTAARWVHRYVALQEGDMEYKRPSRGSKQRVRTVGGISSKQDKQEE